MVDVAIIAAYDVKYENIAAMSEMWYFVVHTKSLTKSNEAVLRQYNFHIYVVGKLYHITKNLPIKFC